ncbi:IS6 family transposase, partial [Bacillus pseudomycoides]
LRKQGFFQTTIHYTIKHLNNLIEQDHRHVKRCFTKSAGFQ